MNLYIHTPFCRKKCAYCAFYSEGSPSPEDIRAYFGKLREDLLRAEIRAEITTLYIGGGTPTLFDAETLDRFYEFLRRTFRFSPHPEITSECNPETLTAEKADAMKGFINRVSMGVQSFSPRKLAAMGRVCQDPESGIRAVELLRKAGIGNVGLDLIYAVPGETLEEWAADLQHAVSLNVNHLSCYSLTIEENTPLAKRYPDLPAELPLSADMWEVAGTYLKEAGLPRYEISNYASPEFECRHNQNVWHGEKYLGFGPSACSFDGTDRFEQASPLKKWLSDAPPVYDVIPRESRLREIFIMGLRTVRGWKNGEFDARFLAPELSQLIRDGLLLSDDAGIRLTARGLELWNDAAEALIQ